MKTDTWGPAMTPHFMMLLFGAIVLAQREHEPLGPRHFLLAVCYHNGPLWRSVVSDLGLDASALRLHLEKSLDEHRTAKDPSDVSGGEYTESAQKILGAAAEYGMQEKGRAPLTIATVLRAVAKDDSIAEALRELGLEVLQFREAIDRNLPLQRDEV